MKTIAPDNKNIAACGLYCGACRKFLAEKCSGCKPNKKATWCKMSEQSTIKKWASSSAG